MNIMKNKFLTKLENGITDSLLNSPSWLLEMVIWIVFGVSYVVSLFNGKDPIKGHQTWKYKFTENKTYKKKKGLMHIFKRWELQDYSRWT